MIQAVLSERHALRLANSYERWTGKPLLARHEWIEGTTLADALLRAPFILLSHGTEDDPVLNFGNEEALALWEMDFAAFTSTPSRLTAEAPSREARDKFLRQVSKHGYVDNYSGNRIASSGRRFTIERAVVWNVLDEAGNAAGQAAMFREWRYVEPTTPEALLQDAREWAERLLATDTSGHDKEHAARVARTAIRLAEVEGGDRLLCELAGWVHDVADEKMKKTIVDGRGRLVRWLDAHRVEAAFRNRLLHIVDAISFGGR